METRHRLRLPLRCPVIFASEEIVGEGTVIDLGVPGCAVEAYTAPLPGEYVRLHVLMPDQHGPLQVLLAKVRWQHQTRFGVEFLKVQDEPRFRLGRLLQTHAAGL